MGIKEMGMFLILISYLQQLHPAPLHKIVHSVSMQQNDVEVESKAMNDKMSTKVVSGRMGSFRKLGSGLEHIVSVQRRGGIGGGHARAGSQARARAQPQARKRGVGGVVGGGGHAMTGVSEGSHATGGGRSSGTGENSEAGGSKSPNTPGTTAVIPIYAAAAGGHRNTNAHHNGGDRRNRGYVGLTTLGGVILASLHLHLHGV